MKPIILLAALIAPVTIAITPAHAQWTSKPYRAIGTEPFWSIDITRRTITYRELDGRPVTVAKPRAIEERNGTTYRAKGMTIAITHVRCGDGMSDHTYADTVKVTIGRRQLSGCGGGVIARGGRALRIT